MGRVVTLRDITDRKQVEEALRLSNQQLQHQIAEREQLIGDLDSFAHTVAHDLKNPINLIIFASDTLVEDLATAVDADSLELLQGILRTGHRASNIINDLLLLASVRQQEMEPRSLDMGEIVSRAIAQLNYLIEKSGAEILVPDTWPQAIGYAPWIERVWTNYLSNAIKYGGDPPRIELGASCQADGFIRFWISDNGAGISLATQQQLFVAFTRLHAAQAPGHGLGLSIVKRIIEKLGGEVGMKSQGVSGQGATFYFTLPAFGGTAWNCIPAESEENKRGAS
jgi:two-component system, sensor histidine kinase and response regulator